MTTGMRITISAYSVHAALAQWVAERKEREAEHTPEHVALDRARSHAMTPSQYADLMAPYIFSLLQRFQEPSP